MGDKDYFDETPDGNKVLKTEGKSILVIKWQETWLHCAHVLGLYRRQNLRAMS